MGAAATLTGNAPVRPAFHHAFNARLTPFGNPGNALDFRG